MRNRANQILSKILDYLFPRNRPAVLLEELLKNSNLHTLPCAEILHTDYFALFSYKDTRVKELIHQIKYRGNQEHIESAGKLLYDYLLEEISDKRLFYNEIWLVPIPINKNHRIERGYNQTEKLAEAILSYDKDKLMRYKHNLLQKIKDTRSQTETKNKGERLQNLKNCFVTNQQKGEVSPLIVVIDDVVTTGATFREARRALSQAGFDTIIHLALAH